MHFRLPRRHRRKLFFPPGLLALAGLLWLGCVALGPWRERLGPRYAIQLTMLPKPVSDTIFQTGYNLEYRTIPFLYSQLFTLYSWKDIRLNGNATHDSLAAVSISRTIQRMRTDTVPNCGVRVGFTPQVTYKGWVKLIDLMSVNKINKYLFDIHHGPFALYVLVDDYTPRPKSKLIETIGPVFLCGTNDYILQLPSPSADVSLWGRLFEAPEWRWPLALLAAIAALSSWHIFRAWRIA